MPPTPTITLDARGQDDLELLLAGALAPQEDFGEPDDGVALIVSSGRAAPLRQGMTVRLLDVEGAPLAEVTIERTYRADADRVGLIGRARQISTRAARPFESLYRRPDDVRGAAGDEVVVVADAPPSTSDITSITSMANGRAVMLLALVGAGRPQGISAAGLIRATIAGAGLIPNARVIAVPLADHGDSTLDEKLTVRVVAAYTGRDPGDPAVWYPSGMGEWPQVIGEVLRKERPTGPDRGLVVFFTGLSGSGKSTIARGLHNRLIERGNRSATVLDGDVVRRHLSAGLGFSRVDRDMNIRRIGWVAAEISRHGGIAIVSPIAPFDETRKAVRAMVADAGGAFVLVYVATPPAECERRDRKGLYARARAGEIAEFTGISSPYEEPTDAHLRIDTTTCSPGEAVERVLAELKRRGLVI